MNIAKHQNVSDEYRASQPVVFPFSTSVGSLEAEEPFSCGMDRQAAHIGIVG
jgi:hypothetical protein